MACQSLLSCTGMIRQSMCGVFTCGSWAHSTYMLDLLSHPAHALQGNGRADARADKPTLHSHAAEEAETSEFSTSDLVQALLQSEGLNDLPVDRLERMLRSSS